MLARQPAGGSMMVGPYGVALPTDGRIGGESFEDVQSDQRRVPEHQPSNEVAQNCRLPEARRDRAAHLGSDENRLEENGDVRNLVCATWSTTGLPAPAEANARATPTAKRDWNGAGALAWGEGCHNRLLLDTTYGPPPRCLQALPCRLAYGRPCAAPGSRVASSRRASLSPPRQQSADVRSLQKRACWQTGMHLPVRTGQNFRNSQWQRRLAKRHHIPQGVRTRQRP